MARRARAGGHLQRLLHGAADAVDERLRGAGRNGNGRCRRQDRLDAHVVRRDPDGARDLHATGRGEAGSAGRGQALLDELPVDAAVERSEDRSRVEIDRDETSAWGVQIENLGLQEGARAHEHVTRGRAGGVAHVEDMRALARVHRMRQVEGTRVSIIAAGVVRTRLRANRVIRRVRADTASIGAVTLAVVDAVIDAIVDASIRRATSHALLLADLRIAPRGALRNARLDGVLRRARSAGPIVQLKRDVDRVHDVGDARAAIATAVDVAE